MSGGSSLYQHGVRDAVAYVRACVKQQLTERERLLSGAAPHVTAKMRAKDCYAYATKLEDLASRMELALKANVVSVQQLGLESGTDKASLETAVEELR